ncbi:alpha/beta fold hydrolase [Tabrizicola sp.]|uniref:alpha/beta fold hydrolase n=1 Tax=Tabrizicola sp. TaxID=2005166 RepID=UPI0027376DF1|nr:alpha/beta fold hydrolase [Tabrizicola sp.]MDP3195103.1 alpha/beta fold hydrolase [Tabrizicola sp.]
MPELLLIHGTCHGAWCFDRLLPELTQRGIPARAIDLPGRDGRPTTLDDYAQTILAAAAPNAILVGHSAGGYAITAAAEVAPDRFRGLIYLCAYLPAVGQSLADMRRAGPSQPLMPAIRLAGDKQSFTIDPALAPAAFYQDCPPDLAKWATARLCPQPVTPQQTPLWPKQAETLPRHFIVCETDQTIPPDYQRQMAARLPQECRHSLPSGHSPFLAMPVQLADLLARLRQSILE